MARISLVLCTSHTPFLFTPPEEWNRIRAKRVLRSDVPHDSDQVNAQHYRRCLDALAILRSQVEAARPDVLIVFGDDQGEQFSLSNFPALGVFLGEDFEGYRTLAAPAPVPGAERVLRPKTPDNWVRVQGHPTLARQVTSRLIERGFDVAFSLSLNNPEEGMGHAFLRPLFFVDPSYQIPVIPIFVNCYYPPQPTGRRCLELGRTLRQILEEIPDQLSVGIVGSGGLWHTPGQPDAYLDEEFDRVILDGVRTGDAERMATYFDARAPSRDLLSRDTGMNGGLGSGTGEVRNWIAAAGTVEGTPGTVVDHVLAYASPIGIGFAYWRPV